MTHGLQSIYFAALGVGTCWRYEQKWKGAGQWRDQKYTVLGLFWIVEQLQDIVGNLSYSSLSICFQLQKPGSAKVTKGSVVYTLGCTGLNLVAVKNCLSSYVFF